MAEKMDKLTYVDPAEILIEDNAARYGLKRDRLDRLKADVVATGAIRQSVELEPLPKGHASGLKYRLTAGFYRVTAANELNEQGAGLQVPAIIHPLATSLERVTRQVSENNERENLSPMDKAIAMARLMAAGASKMDLRKIFALPKGVKNNELQLASNAHINMTLSFLELPKDVQAKIHDGRITVGGAYELTKADPDKRAAMLERIEAARLSQIAADDKEEEKFLNSQRKVEETNEKVETVRKEYAEVAGTVEATTKQLEDARAAAEEAVQASATAFIAAKAKGLSEEEKTAKTEAHKATLTAIKETEKAVKEAEKAAAAAAKEADKLKEKVQTAEEKAATNAAALAEKRAARAAKTPPATEKPIGRKAVQQAADGLVWLSAKEMREAIHTLSLPGASDKVQQIGKAFKDCFSGVITPQQLTKALQKIVGEVPAAKKK